MAATAGITATGTTSSTTAGMVATVATGGTEQPRQLSSDATLRDLVLSRWHDRGAAEAGFHAGDGTYTAAVESEVTQVTVTPTPTHPRAQVAYLVPERPCADGCKRQEQRVPGRRGCGGYRDQSQSDGGRRQHDANVYGDGDRDAAAVNGRDVARPCPESRDDRGAIDAGVSCRRRKHVHGKSSQSP